jgi:hypothetical protein
MRNRLRAVKVKAADVRPRVESFGVAVSGPSLALGKSRYDHDRAVARAVLADLEDRRVLYHPPRMEVRESVVGSVQGMRHMLTDKIGELEEDSPLRPLLRQIRAACRRFLDDEEGPGPLPMSRFRPWDDDEAVPPFWPALQELRTLTGVCVAAIASRYSLDVESELAVYLPPAPSDDD